MFWWFKLFGKRVEVLPLARLTSRYSPAELARMTALFFPEERRHKFTPEPWDGESFRHYGNPKIVCLEHYRPQDKPRLLVIGRKPAA
jgi:hypothetical protein